MDTVQVSDQENNHPNMPNQYARVKNAEKGKEVAQDDMNPTYVVKVIMQII